MADILRDEGYFFEALRLSYARLGNKCKYYDAGDELIAIDIAVQIRTLVYDTEKSVSLLSRVNKKESDFFDSSTEHSGGVNNILITGDFCNNIVIADDNREFCLVRKWFHDGKVKYIPLGNNHERFRKKPFDAWWKQAICRFPLGDEKIQYELTRMDLITIVANKDGGAHFDKMVSSKFVHYKRTDILGLTINGRCIETENVPLYPTIRQIASEMLQTLGSIISQL